MKYKDVEIFFADSPVFMVDPETGEPINKPDGKPYEIMELKTAMTEKSYFIGDVVDELIEYLNEKESNRKVEYLYLASVSLVQYVNADAIRAKVRYAALYNPIYNKDA